jgi:hypothetical protein
LGRQHGFPEERDKATLKPLMGETVRNRKLN